MMLDMERPTEEALPVDGPASPRAKGGRKRPTRPTRPTRPDAEEGGRYDVRNSWQVVAGSILIPLGLVFILIAWYGAAHARVVQQQIPYMVSGAFIGLGCMIVGGLLYWGHWLYRIYDQSELHHQEQQQVLQELVRTLATNPGVGTGGAMAVGSEAGGSSVAGGSTGSYLATASGSVYHQADCVIIAHHPGDLRVVDATDTGGLRPCQICSPPD
jgi:hypothetical protein